MTQEPVELLGSVHPPLMWPVLLDVDELAAFRCNPGHQSKNVGACDGCLDRARDFILRLSAAALSAGSPVALPDTEVESLYIQSEDVIEPPTLITTCPECGHESPHRKSFGSPAALGEAKP